ncbi:MAG: cupredoxin domain-containing protein [Chloroflexi bacterium]|nr:cupredoxin domain-containing protein [Chloroflexota bacterium]
MTTLSLLAAAACARGEPGREVPVAAEERGDGRMAFEPARVTVRAGEGVTFVVTNRGAGDHEFESDEAGIEEVLILPGRTRRVPWRAPSRAGSYPVYCDISGHREAGMEMMVVVEAAPSS